MAQNKIVIGGVEFDAECPKRCPAQGSLSALSQGGICHRCPVFNCVGEFRLIEPEDYRSDWARAWREWFDTGMSGWPVLPLEKVDCL